MEAAKEKVNIWKANIAHNLSKSKSALAAVVPGIERNLRQNKQPATVERLEQIALHQMRVKTYEHVLDQIGVILGDLPNIINGNACPNAVSAAEYLKAVTLADQQKISKDSMEVIFKKIKVHSTIPDHDALISYSKEKITPDDVIKYTNEIAVDLGDTENQLVKVLLQGQKYKAKAQEFLKEMERQRIANQPPVNAGYASPSSYQTPPPGNGFQMPPPTNGYQTQTNGYQMPPPTNGYQTQTNGYQMPPPINDCKMPPPTEGYQMPPPMQGYPFIDYSQLPQGGMIMPPPPMYPTLNSHGPQDNAYSNLPPMQMMPTVPTENEKLPFDPTAVSNDLDLFTSMVVTKDQ